MKNLLWIGGVVLGLWLAGCATPETRVKKNEALVNSWPAEVQQQVRAGQVAVGFTPEMVRVALGEPDRVATRTTAEGVAEVWGYYEKGPRFSFGVGVGTASGSGAVGGGVVVGDDGRREEAVMSVVFSAGRVSAVERRK